MLTRRAAGAAVVLGALFLAAAAPAADADGQYQFVILSDRTGGHTEGVYPKVIEEINLLSPDFVVTVGDHIEGYGEDFERVNAEWDTLLAMLDTIDAPVYMTPGNHDIWSDESEAIYVERTGQKPHYSFDHGSTHFVILDVSRIETPEEFPDGQLAWLRADLEAAQSADAIYVFFHKPIWAGTLTVGNPDPLHEVFVEFGVDAVFNGHLHHYFSVNYDGVDYTVMGSSGGHMYRSATQPVARGEFFQFGWVTVSPEGYQLAVIDVGGIYPREVVTSDDIVEIERIEGELVGLSALYVNEAELIDTTITVSVENTSDDPIENLLEWEVPEGWLVTPVVADLVVAPGEAQEMEFSVVNTGSLYPVPRVSCAYPMTNGMKIDVDMPLDVKRTVGAPRVDEAPTIDGIVNQDEWKGVEPATVLYPPYDAEVEGATEFRFAYDDENLYLSAVCYDPAMSEITANVEERDGAVYGEDCVGFFFAPDWQDMVVYQIYFNPLGTPFDQRITFDENMYYTADRDWDGHYEVAVQRTEHYWSTEVRMPMDEVEGDVVANPNWGLNFRRKQPRTDSACDWQIPIDYDPGTFGELQFGE